MVFKDIKRKNWLFGTLTLLAITAVLLFNTSCCPSSRADFTFVFMTDIHLQPELNAVAGFSRAIERVNKLAPDFVITGGDLVMDTLETKFARADMLYNLYLKTSGKFKMPVYNTLGNHEIFGLYEKSGISPDHPEYGKKMFAKRIGKTYYSFDFKGWHFMILDSVVGVDREKYRGLISDEQVEWIKDDLAGVDKNTPLVICTHIPFITSATQIDKGSLEANGENIVINNSKEVLDLFTSHNLKLILQGHLHFLEDIYVAGLHFITGGAVSGKWWEGPNRGTEEGFLLIKVRKDKFTWEYIDYGWEVPAGSDG